MSDSLLRVRNLHTWIGEDPPSRVVDGVDLAQGHYLIRADYLGTDVYMFSGDHSLVAVGVDAACAHPGTEDVELPGTLHGQPAQLIAADRLGPRVHRVDDRRGAAPSSVSSWVGFQPAATAASQGSCGSYWRGWRNRYPCSRRSKTRCSS